MNIQYSFGCVVSDMTIYLKFFAFCFRSGIIFSGPRWKKKKKIISKFVDLAG